MRVSENETFPKRVRVRESGQKRQRAIEKTRRASRLLVAGIDAKRRMGWTLPNRRARRKYAQELASTLGEIR